MSWLIITIFAYFLFAVVNLVDKYLLVKRIPSPKVYAFYAGMLGISILVLVPFGFLTFPEWNILLLALAAGVFHILGVFAFFVGLKKFEASRIMPAMSALLPIFTLGLALAFGGQTEELRFFDVLAFFLLLSGTVLITWKKERSITFTSIKIALISAFFLALYFFSAKIVYLEEPFISGFIWTRIGAFLIALCFFFFREVREDIKKPKAVQNKTWAIFLPNEGASAGAFLLQNWAISLAPLAFLGIINALEGVKFVFILIFVTVISFRFPQILREEVSREILFQKVIAILLIGGGLAMLSMRWI